MRIASRAQQKGHKPFIEATGPFTVLACPLAPRSMTRAMNELDGLLEIRSFGYRLEPRYIFRAGRLDQ